MTAARGGITQLADHLSASEIAALRLPGLPTTKYRVLQVAAREGWTAFQRRGRGGGSAFAVASLPEPARAELARRRAIAEARTAPTVRQPANDVRRGRGRPKGTDFFTRNPLVADAVEAIIASQKLAAPRILELLETRFGDEVPRLATLRRFIASLEASRPALLASMRDPDLYKSRHRLALGRADGGISRAHQRWEIDTTKADVLTKGGRKSILGIIDVYSRRVRFLVVDSESGQSVRRMLVTTIEAWGVVPEELGTDNGSGFINRSIVSALPTLGIAHDPCLPGAPESKPYIERVFGTFTRERAELLAGYAGHSVAEAQKLRAREKKRTGRAVVVPELAADELQRILDNWTSGVYYYRTHGSLGISPFERERQSPAPARRAPHVDVLRMALSRAEGTYTVGKRGIQWKKGRYWSEALVLFVGRQVQVRRDEDDLGALFVFDEQNRFIDIAVDHKRAGLSEAEFAAAARAHQDAWMSAARRNIRQKQQAFSYDQARDALLRRDAEAAGKLTPFPVSTADHSTATIESLGAAPAGPSRDELAAIDRRIAERLRPAAQPATPVAAKVAAADAVIAAANRGQAVDPAELQRARLYAQSSEYRAEKMVSARFAPPAADAGPMMKGQVA